MTIHCELKNNYLIYPLFIFINILIHKTFAGNHTCISLMIFQECFM